LKTTIVVLRRQIEDKQGAVSRLETLLRERLTRIDALSDRIEQLRAQNQRLDQEAERLAAMVRLPTAASLPTN
jgi:chromosome segregation ATPase